ncbi:MAG: sigma 54-interacting transcriptional regulator [Thermodesulfobacteriota bacterium]|nr:sigma 54-interacting transcriptional regulator [Thermodesulfobacteriota bacterium]
MNPKLENQTEIILDSIADGVFTVDSEWRITSFNRAAGKITRIKKEEAIGRHCWDVFRASICEGRCSLRQTMETGEPIVNQSIFIVSSEGERIPVSISTALLKDEEDRVIGGVETFRDLSVVEELRRELEGRHSFHDIVSKNQEMHRLFGILEQVAGSNTTVLLVGESGTGKELFARAIHALSPRKNGPMVTINCGALPDNLLESELFGYRAGAFTDAKKDKPGRLALAEGGTLFLDEIGDISPAMQARLLRVLQDRVYEPLGSTKPLKADVRIVSATNRNLEELVSQRRFRQDLYYRINVVRLVLPPLRERREDIPLLADHFVRKFNRLNGSETRGLSPEVLSILMAHDFQGNVRELENVVEYATVVCKNSLVGIEHLPDYLREDVKIPGKAPEEEGLENHLNFDDLERHFLLETLRKNHWNRSATAAQLGIHKATLWRKIKRLNIRVPRQNGRTKARLG